MRFQKPVGLIAAGRISESRLTRLPNLCAGIGPIFASSTRVASRFAKTLKSGFAVASLTELETCRLILICAPEADLQAIVQMLLKSSLSWKRHCVALFDSSLDLSPLQPLRHKGAATCLLSPVAGMELSLFVLEGDTPARREAKGVLRHAGIGALELKSGSPFLYQAGLTAIASLLIPVLEASERCLRESGIPQRQARRLVERWIERQMQGFVASGRKSWAHPGAGTKKAGLFRQIEALEKSDPALARFFVESLHNSMNLMGVDASFLGRSRSASAGK
jgi:hypothetical protein